MYNISFYPICVRGTESLPPLSFLSISRDWVFKMTSKLVTFPQFFGIDIDDVVLAHTDKAVAIKTSSLKATVLLLK